MCEQEDIFYKAILFVTSYSYHTSFCTAHYLARKVLTKMAVLASCMALLYDERRQRQTQFEKGREKWQNVKLRF